MSKSDLDALEKEISIDIADLRRDIRRLKKDLFKSPAKRIPTPKNCISKKSPNELTVITILNVFYDTTIDKLN